MKRACLDSFLTKEKSSNERMKIKFYDFFFRQYLWVDEKGKKSRLSANQYIDFSMSYVQKTINDEATFPTKHGKTSKLIFWKRLHFFSILQAMISLQVSTLRSGRYFGFYFTSWLIFTIVTSRRLYCFNCMLI